MIILAFLLLSIGLQAMDEQPLLVTDNDAAGIEPTCKDKLYDIFCFSCAICSEKTFEEDFKKAIRKKYNVKTEEPLIDFSNNQDFAAYKETREERQACLCSICCRPCLFCSAVIDERL